MKIRIFIAILIASTNIISSNDFSIYKEELVKTFDVGKEIGKLGYIREVNPTDPWGPNSLVFDNENNLYINDTWNLRLLKLDNTYNITKEMILKDSDYFFTSGQMNIINNVFIGSDFEEIFCDYNLEENATTFILNISNSEWKTLFADGSFNIIGNNVFLWSNNKWYLFYDLGKNNEENLKKVYSGDKLKNYLDKVTAQSNNALHEISIKGEFLFIKDKLLTRSFKTFNYYWQEVHSIEPLYSEKHNLPDGVVLNDINLPTIYLGDDLDGNSYWKIHRQHIFVFNKKGWLIDALKINFRIMKVIPTIKPNGDIYFFDFDSKEIKLYRIKRQW